MLDNTNMGGGDGRPKYLHILQVKLEKVIILIAFFCKVALLCNITARRVEKLCCAFYHSHVQTAVLQQFRLLVVSRLRSKFKPESRCPYYKLQNICTDKKKKRNCAEEFQFCPPPD